MTTDSLAATSLTAILGPAALKRIGAAPLNDTLLVSIKGHVRDG